jgi:F-box-like
MVTSQLFPTTLMWPPANSHALPSIDETIFIKKAITNLERELVAAVTLLQQTQLHITKLKEGLEQRRAWIAPIRKVPFEVLSEIFITCSREERFSPMIVAAVSRRWRDTILATPLAWRRIFPYGERKTSPTPPVEYVSTFIKRSHPCLLHIRTGPHHGGFLCEDILLNKGWECN